MKILIFGAGGVGSVVGALLARTGHEVTLLGRPWHLDVIKKNGLAVTGIWGDYRIKAFDLYTDAQSLYKSGADFDLVIFTVKAFDTQKAIQEASVFIKNKTMLLSLQNGLGNIETILKFISGENFLVGRIITGVETSPGQVTVTVSADSIRIGPAPGFVPKISAEKVAHELATAKIPTMPVQNILPYIWSKVIYNASLNAICSLNEIPYGKILENEKTKEQMAQIVRECYAVAKKKNIFLEPVDADAYLKLLVDELIPRTAAHLPSMLQDLKKGKRTDIDALNGAISRLGKELGVTTPVNDEITSLIQSKELNFVKK